MSFQIKNKPGRASSNINARIKTEYVSDVLKKSARLIREAQQVVADEWNLFEGGELKKSLQGHFSVDSPESGGRLTMHYLTYARFLDMKDRRRKLKAEGYHLYNRIVFGTIYNYTLGSLIYGLTEDIIEQYRQRIPEIMEQNPLLGSLQIKNIT